MDVTYDPDVHELLIHIYVGEKDLFPEQFIRSEWQGYWCKWNKMRQLDVARELESDKTTTPQNPNLICWS